MHVPVLLAGVLHEHLDRGQPACLGERDRAQRLRVGHPLEDLSPDHPLSRGDLPVLAVEGDLESGVRGHHEAPGAADPQVDVHAGHFAPVPAPPAPDQVRFGPGPVDQAGGSVELPGDQDLRVLRQGHHCPAATCHGHSPRPPLP